VNRLERISYEALTILDKTFSDLVSNRIDLSKLRKALEEKKEVCGTCRFSGNEVEMCRDMVVLCNRAKGIGGLRGILDPDKDFCSRWEKSDE